MKYPGLEEQKDQQFQPQKSQPEARNRWRPTQHMVKVIQGVAGDRDTYRA